MSTKRSKFTYRQVFEKKMEEPNINLDYVLDKFSIFGRYHLRMMFFGMFAFATNSVFCATYVFAVEDTSYRCVHEAYKTNTCETINGIRCTDWIYNSENSFIAELACQEWKRALVGTSFSFGYMVGLFMVGPLSDRIGRKKALIGAGVTGAVIGIAKSYSSSYWMYVALEFLGAALGDCYSPLYILNLEMVSTKNRVAFNLLSGLGYTIGGVLLPAAAWGVPYWRHFLRTVYTPALLFIAFCFLDESPRWLLTRSNKKERAVKILKKMARQNKVKLENHEIDKLTVKEDEGNGENVALVDLLKITIKSKVLLKRFLVCIVWWSTCTFVTYGSMIHSVSLQGNKYINFALIHIIDLPGNFIIIYILNKFNRRNPLICTFFAAAVLFLVHPFLPSDINWLSVTIFMASKLMSSFYFSITYIYTSELFPTYTRNSMHAICSAIGRIGGILAPQTPLLMVYWSGFPALLFSCSSLVAGLVTFLVPETADVALPDTVTQAELIGNKQNNNSQNIAGNDNLGMTME